jgi:predicted extracellular nuclease
MMAVLLMVGMVGIQPAKPVQAANPLRISQVYGGGGSVGSTYTHDFVEIFNSGTSPVSLAGMSIQYASATGPGNFGATTTTRTELPNVMLGPGQYFLVQEAGGTIGSSLPTPDLIDTTPINASVTAGKVALVNSQVTLGCNGGSTPCPPEQLALIIDLVGYGTADFYEGAAPAPAPSVSSSVIRKDGGCTDTDDNAADFEALLPTPRNTASPTYACGPVEIFPTELFFSEYIEGSGNNKALEIFNGTGAVVDLSNYQILYFNNGSPTPTITYPLAGTVADGDVFVLTTNEANQILIDAADVVLTYPSVVHFNGDDALALQKIEPLTMLDVIGEIGFDPGTSWGTDPITTAEHTLTRKDTICEGDPDGSDPFDPALEWNGFAADTFDYIGAHDTNCLPPAEEAPTVVSTSPADGAINVAVDANITITFSEPVTVTGDWFTISCTESGTHTAAVTDTDPVFTLVPDTVFATSETCTVTVLAAGVTDDDTDDTEFDAMLEDHVFTFDTIAACGDPFLAIYAIQGDGASSPLVGQTVTTEGVVVGDFQAGGKNGFFIQDQTGDGDAATSDGIFIYYPGAPDVNEGDKVRLTGSVSEYYQLTQITGSSLQLCSIENTITPTPVSLPVTDVSDFEKYEGMLVTFPQPLIISEYFNFDRYGEIVLTSTRHMTPTAVEEPGSPEQAAAAEAYKLDRITLDDGRTNQNPDPAIHPNGEIFTMDNLFRGGGTVTNITGVMDYSFDLYRIQPTAGAIYEDANPRTEAPDIIEADLKVTSFNVLNYFVTLDDGTNDICGPSGTMECRGADDAEEFERQKAKILAALDAIDSDIYGLMEIENDSPVSENDAVADLVAGLNAIKGEGTYAYIETDAIGTDAIKQAILYKPASVTPVGDYQVLDSSVDARFIDTANRPVLAQVFVDNKGGVPFVVAVNHLKSKGSACVDDPDLGDGQGNCNLTRLAAAQAMVDWLANPTYFPDLEKVLIIGDLNSYDKEDPIDAIKLGADDTADTDDDYLDMIFEKRGEFAYGYVYDGQTGYLGHALANHAMADSIVDVNIWHINADEPDLIDYDTSFKADAQDDLYAPDAYRSSDHDPVIVTLNVLTLEEQITAAVDYVYDPVYDYTGLIGFDDLNNIFTASYTVPQFGAGGSMNDLARYLGALYRQHDSSVSSILFNSVTYTWNPAGTLKGSNWEDASGNTLVSAMVAYYLATPGDLLVTVSDPTLTSIITFRIVLLDTLDAEIASAPSYVYDPAYTYVGTYEFEDATNIYTVTYDDVEFNPGAMNDLARYLGALYRQEGSTVTSIVYGGETYTWDPEVGLLGSNWVDEEGNTLVSKIVDDFEAGQIDPVAGLELTVADGVHTEEVIFQFVILDTIAPVMELVTPPEGLVTLGLDETFVLTVDAFDLNLYELEIDHSFEGTLPEFSVYASEATPWGTEADKDMFDAAGVTVEYDGSAQKWTIDFGEAITDTYFIPNGVTFYMVLLDEAGNQWGTMYGTTPENTYVYTFEVTNTLEEEITSAVTYEYTPVYDYVGDIVFDDPNNIFTATYSPAEFLANGAVYDLARYLGALYRQDTSTIISITFNSLEYTWDETGTLKGSNWEDESGNTLVSAMVAYYFSTAYDPVVGMPITVHDGWHTANVTFKLIITDTLDAEIASAPSYVYDPAYTYVGTYEFEDATNIYTVTYDDVEFNPGAMNDLARYLGALYRQEGSTVISIVYDGVTYTWDETGTLKGSNWVDSLGNTLVSAVVAGIDSYNPAVGLIFTLSDGLHTENVTFKFVILDTTAPEIASGVAKSASHGDVLLVDGSFTVNQGYVVDTIEITMTEPVLVELGTIVTMEGYGPYGTITAHLDGMITITPYLGNEMAALIGTFTFTVPDGSVTDLAGNAFTGSIILEVLNVAPVAVDDSYSVAEDGVLTVEVRGVLTNDTDFDPTILTAVKVTDPANGTVELNANGSFTYTPDADFNGTDAFTYKANDGYDDSNVATVTITVTEIKDQVQAVDDFYTTDEDTTLTVEAPGVLANDIDVDGNLQAASLVTDVQHGSLSLLGDGSFVYTPDPDFYGTDTFVYKLITYPAPQSLWTDEATVTITVNSVDDAPVLGLIEGATIPELVEFSFTATATDVDLPAQVLTFSLVGAPDGAAINAETGIFTWTPSEEQGPGVYPFTVKVCDETDPTPLCDEQEVTLTVTEVNAAPVAQDKTATTPEDSSVDVTLVATDAEDDTLTYAILDQPAHGTVTLVGDVATYTPELDFNGEDSFTYKANDGMADSEMAVVTITVTPVNDAPVAEDDQYVTDEDVMLTVPAPGVLDNDFDVEGEEMTIIPVADVSNGTLNWTLNGGFTYTPDAKFNGTDTFSYKLFDGDAYSNIATVTITVTPVNDWPIANDDFYEVVTGTDLVKDAAEGILANDVLLDPDEEVSIQILEGPQHGTLSMNDDGSFTYTPNAGFMGTDTFRYLVLSVRTINAEWSDDATVTITVEPLMRLFLPLILR